MKRLYIVIYFMVFCAYSTFAQEFDLNYSGSESGTQTHVARNSVTLEAGYTYTPSGGTLSIAIQNPVVSGSMTYTSTPVDPETRALNTSYMVGATNGSFNVNPMGGASYSIPLEMLPGVNGLAPGLSLVYSSNSGAGIAGYGWQIAGLSAITRGPKDYYHDGTARGVELDTTDRFYLDGQRLVPTTSGAYSSSAALYQTDNDIFTRVTPNGTAGNGPAWFKAETKSGFLCEYGNTTGSKQMISGLSQVVNWYVSKISDLFGNQINFAYLKDNYGIYPAEITYGPNTITFYYKGRSDNNTSYLKGTKIEQRYILDNITIKYNSTIVKTYEFKYNYNGSFYNSYSILNEIVEYGIGTSRVNSTAITYQTPENVSFTQAIYNTTHTYISHDSKLFSGDFNGDGKADIFCLPSGGGWRYYKGNGDNTFTLSSSGDFSIDELSIIKLVVLDLNGDNKDDIVFTIPFAKYYYAISDGTTFGSAIYFAELSGSLFVYKRDKTSAGDLNGDGLNDQIVVNPNGELKIYSYLYASGQLQSMSLRNTLNFGASVSTSDILYLADFNGDGMAEIWKINSSGIKIYAVRGSSLIELYTNSIPTTSYYFMSGDYNGDGKTDLFLYGYSSYDWSDWQLRLSTGTSFETFCVPQKRMNLKNDIVRTGDFNGDGCTDLMITASSDNGWTGHCYYIAKNKGTDFYSHFYSSGQTASNNYYIDDYDGDGRDDYLCTDGVSPWWTGYKIYKAPGKTNILMEKVGNGLGFLTKLNYTKLSQATTSTYQRGTGAAFPVSDFQGPLTVITSAQYDNGCGTLNSQDYYYEGIKIHRQGKGFLGYAKTRVTDVASGNTSENTSDYNTTYFYPQATGYSKKRGQTDPYETVTNIWSQKVLDASKKRIFPFIQSSIQTNVLTGHTVTTTIADYDNYGNPSPITKSYGNGPTETTTITYNNIVSPTKWLLGRPTATTIQYASGGNTITRSGTRVYDSNNNHLNSETWHAGTNNQIVKTYGYNTNGTLQWQTATANSQSRTTQYTYETTNGIRVKTIIDPLSHTTTNTYDTYGRLYTQQDYLGNTVTYQYDNLGRQTQESNTDGGIANSVYAWESPTATPLLARYSIQTTGNNGSLSKMWYDKLGREIRSDVKGFDGTMIYTGTEYNIKGQVYRVSEPYFPSETATWNVPGYDNYGRKTSLTTPSGRNSTWQYTNNTTSSTITETTAGKTYSKTYAVDGTLASANDAGGTISYTYFPDGKAKTITAPGGIITSMQYDIAGNQTQLVDPSAGTINYTYNGFGELLTQQNARSQTTTLTYYADGRLSQKVTVEGTTSYTYNANKQLTGISSPGSVSRSYGYDSKGRVSNTTETIPGSTAFSTSFTYDDKGRLSTTTYPSGIVETSNYNGNGYKASVSTGGVARYTTLATNARGQVTSGQYGTSLNTTLGYNSYGYPTSAVTGSLQSYQYEFNPVTGNLNYRKNVLQANIQENFEYDGLDRLDRVYRGGTTLLDMAYEGNKGGITTKTDMGTLQYSLSAKPYQLSGIDCTTGLITASMNNAITYTSFESVNTITQGIYNAAFTYNADNERVKMVINQSGSPILTRWYPGSSYIKETAGAVTKEYTFIGGDAYSAPVVAITQSGTTTYYNILCDYLGNITHVVNASTNALVAEYSYDAWGRMRNPATWVNYAPGSEPDLFIAGRGYTGHEHLPWFNLINMNGRVYDPLAGQFLSPDNYNQAPGFTQSYNRYGYCLNNPLKYTDPSGESWGWLGWVIGGVGGGIYNVVNNWDNIDNFGDGFAYFNIGGLAGSGAAFLSDLGVEAPGIGIFYNWMTKTGNGLIEGKSGSEIMEAGTQGALWGGVSGFAMEGLSGLFNIPINVKTGSGLVEPITLKPQTTQISLGEWLFGSHSSQISNIIAEQGTTNLTMVLAASNSALDLSLVPRSTPQPMYESSSFVFNGTNLSLIDIYSNGTSVTWDSWQACSGAQVTGNGRLPNGNYQSSNLRLRTLQTMTRDGVGFSMDLDPQFTTDRTLLRIHPDGQANGMWWLNNGTDGCIGLQENATRLNSFYNIILNRLRSNNGVIYLHVNY